MGRKVGDLQKVAEVPEGPYKPPGGLREIQQHWDSLASSSVSFFLVFLVSLSFSLDFPHSLSITFSYLLSLIPSLQSMPYHSLLSTLF